MGWLRSSGSYLHDRRVKTLDETVTWPGGRRPEPDRRFQALTEVERLQVQGSLKTLVAPSSANSHGVSLAAKRVRAVRHELQQRQEQAVSREKACGPYGA